MTAEGGRAADPMAERHKNDGTPCKLDSDLWCVKDSHYVVRAAQPSESEREGDRNHCEHGLPYVGPACGACFPAPSPPSTGQSREQRLEEALRKYGAHQGDCKAFDDCSCGLRRALESKP
jgi:hypothetical protein